MHSPDWAGNFTHRLLHNRKCFPLKWYCTFSSSSQRLGFFFSISQDSNKLSSCKPSYSGYRVRSIYCAKRLLQARPVCSSSRRHDWFGVMQITNRWKCRLGWCSCLGCLSGCNRLWAILCSDVSTWSQVETNHPQAEGNSVIQMLVYLCLLCFFVSSKTIVDYIINWMSCLQSKFYVCVCVRTWIIEVEIVILIL